MSMTFQLEGQQFIALNGGPMFKFSQAISFFVDCKNQKEIDYLWEKLSQGGTIQQCGWLIDKYGISWQIVPSILGKLMQEKDPIIRKRVFDEMLKMKKLIIKDLEDAS